MTMKVNKCLAIVGFICAALPGARWWWSAFFFNLVAIAAGLYLWTVE